MSSARQWYGVKLLYQSVVSGKPLPERVDGHYSDTHTFFEESVLLIHAKSFAQAYAKAERKAKGYCEVYRNRYGQRVERKLIDAIDCFLIGGELASGTEVYSSIMPVKKSVTPAEYLLGRYQYNLADYEQNASRQKKYARLQRVLTYETFSKWRKIP